MLTVELTRGEIAVAYAWGAMRGGANIGITNGRIGPQSDWNVDIVGMLGELAFCKAWNIYPDFDVALRRGSFDCVLKGKRVDVKSTTVETGKLLAKPGAYANVDRFVLAVVQVPKVALVGWLARDELINQRNIIDLGHGPTYGVEQERLHSFRPESEKAAA